MQIHELNNYEGSIGASAYLAVDNGVDTGKLSASALLGPAEEKIDNVEKSLNARIDNIIAGGDAPSEAEIIDARLGASILGGESYPSLGDAIRGQVTRLKNDLSKIGVLDIFGGAASVAGKNDNLITGAWDANTKTLTVTMSGSKASLDTYYVMLAPKIIANHTYKIAIKYDYPTEYAYTYIRNTYALNNLNYRDDIINGTAKYDDAEEVLTFTATQNGWLALGKAVGANQVQTWSFKIAVYDITGADVSDFDDSVWLAFNDSVIQGERSTYFAYDLVKNLKDEKWSGLGDSLTAGGSGGQYLGYVMSRLGLANYYNCGLGGTSISGATSANAMYQDTRINSLNIASDCVTVLGGTNDAWQEYYKDHPNANLTGWGDCIRTNRDVSTFCGAYNVLISKILYKFCRVPGYYDDIDYSGITQALAAVNNFRLILITPPQAFHVEGDSMSAALQLKGLTAAHNYVKQIAELWGLPCVDTWEMGMNDINRSLFFADYTVDATHFNAFGHERLASLIIDKALQVSRYK